ncbi:MAG TPA: hypothetical protein VM364_13930 [Vicinamibacterales bacterium]|nr:hypothetical protein [Vicinamibacterales bacterium]
MTSLVAAQQDPKGQPFQALWSALAQLGERVTRIEAEAGGGPRIVDAYGQAIGTFGQPILRFAGGLWLSLEAPAQEGFESSTRVTFQFDQPGCTGNAYFFGTPARTPLARAVRVQDGVGYYAGDPLSLVVIRSRHFSDGSCFSNPPPQTMWVHPVATVDLATLGVGTPPYRIE